MILAFVILIVAVFMFGNSNGRLGILGSILLAPFVIVSSGAIIVPLAFLWLIIQVFRYKM